jgi:hypothetical protein
MVRRLPLTVVLIACGALLAAVPGIAAEEEAPPPEDDSEGSEAPQEETVGPFHLPAPTAGPATVSRAGAGASMGFGVWAYDPAPGTTPRVNLPSLEIVTVPPGLKGQLRVRSPLLATVVHAALRRVFHLELDAILLATDCTCAVGNHTIRPLVGPIAGIRVEATPYQALGGAAVGARLGFEYLGPQREVGFFVALEPLLEVWTGDAGSRQITLLGAGAVVQFGITGYRKQVLTEGAK